MHTENFSMNLFQIYMSPFLRVGVGGGGEWGCSYVQCKVEICSVAELSSSK